MRVLFFTCFFAVFSHLAAAESFVVSDIRVEGLQRISAGTVFEAFSIDVGDSVDTQRLTTASKRLFKTALFNDISLQRDGDVLIVQVVELPTITQLEIKGNQAITSEALSDGLKQSGLAEGLVFKRSTLERISLELERQYVAQGRYDANIKTEVTALPRNRVGLVIQVDEGTVASIQHVNIIGNSEFSDEELLKTFQLQTSNFWSWYASDDKYAREKLSGDLESLRSYYLNRGYIRFNIESTQVSVSPNKKGVYITINVSEGDLYTVRELQLAGDLVLPEEELERFYIINEGDVFSRQKVTYSSDLMIKRLGNDGYTFAKVDGIPTIDDETKEVDITFFVEPGKRTYVRRINFAGNESTLDDVLRREMLQMEGGWASTEKIEAGKKRLNQLGFFKGVNVETPAVGGADDLIDVNYSVEEQLSGSLNFNVGYAGGSGFIVGTSISQNNFLGTGNRMSLALQKNNTVQSYNFSFQDPYYTIDGVSRGFNLFYRKTDFSSQSFTSDYQTNTFGGNVSFGYPISNRERLSFTLGASETDMFEGSTVPAEISDFIEERGDHFREYSLGSSWKWSNLNRGLFPTAGAQQSLSFDLAIPGSDLTYYKIGYKADYYIPLNLDWSIRFRTELGYGDGFGDLNQLPFFKNFRAGGVGSVRGYRSSSLGPMGLPEYNLVDLVETDSDGNPIFETDNLGRPIVDSDAAGNIFYKNADGDIVRATNFASYAPVYLTDASNGSIVQAPAYVESATALGGNILIEGSTELIFPFPFVEDRSSLRSVFFLDAGNVFTDKCYKPSDFEAPNFNSHPFCNEGVDLSELRLSTGVGVTWVTAIGPLTFTYSFPLNDKDDDRTEGFEFSLGQVF
jgi:outer membrane protein insertion porin family